MQKSYSFSNIKFSELKKIVAISKSADHTKFTEWFATDYEITADDTLFLEKLIKKHYLYLSSYAEENLKIKFLVPILSRVDFFQGTINDFYDTAFSAEVNGIELKGFPDYMVASGIEEPEKPYFFVQEFKPSQIGKRVDDQLFAELVAAIAINDTNIMRGCYVIGRNWNFVIMEKDENNNYFAHISDQFDCLKIADLTQIYKNLQIVKLHYCQ
jgi:hypothetical protein